MGNSRLANLMAGIGERAAQRGQIEEINEVLRNVPSPVLDALHKALTSGSFHDLVFNTGKVDIKASKTKDADGGYEVDVNGWTSVYTDHVDRYMYIQMTIKENMNPIRITIANELIEKVVNSPAMKLQELDDTCESVDVEPEVEKLEIMD